MLCNLSPEYAGSSSISQVLNMETHARVWRTKEEEK